MISTKYLYFLDYLPFLSWWVVDDGYVVLLYDCNKWRFQLSIRIVGNDHYIFVVRYYDAVWFVILPKSIRVLLILTDKKGRTLYFVLLVWVGCSKIVAILMIDNWISVFLTIIDILYYCIPIVDRFNANVFNLEVISVLITSFHWLLWLLLIKCITIIPI